MVYLVEIVPMRPNPLCFLCSENNEILGPERSMLYTKYRSLWKNEELGAETLDIGGSGKKGRKTLSKSTTNNGK